METSVFIARVFGVFYLVAGLGIMFNRKFYQRFMEDYCNNTALTFLTGMLALVVGIVIVLVHNVWAADWTVIITVVGWAAFIKGIWIIVFPGTVPTVMRAYRENANLLTVHSISALVFGAVLMFFAFFAK